VGFEKLLRLDVRHCRVAPEAFALLARVPPGDDLPDVAEVDLPVEPQRGRLRLRVRLGRCLVPGIDADDVPPAPAPSEAGNPVRTRDAGRDCSRAGQPFQDVPARERGVYCPVVRTRRGVGIGPDAVPTAHW
jgi:hypothetical protein